MKAPDLEKLKFPIGKFDKPTTISNKHLKEYIASIETLPEKLRAHVEILVNAELNTAYRPGGWTIRQVVHHLADSHMNGFIRAKLALTEKNPTIKPYPEALFAELPDTKTMPIETSLILLEGLHARWAVLLKSLSAKDWKKTIVHPEHKRAIALDEYMGMYAWHCNHHLSHITGLKERKGWR